MVQQREEFGLSLSLSVSGSSVQEHKLTNPNNDNQTARLSSPLELKLMPSSTSNPLPKNNTWPPHAPGLKMEACRVDRRRSLTGIDVNRSLTGDVEETLGVSSPNSTLTSLSGIKRSLIREVANGEDVRECSRSEEQEEDGDHCRKKLTLSKDQADILEESFKEHNILNPKRKIALVKRLGLRPRQVEVWFQNRRARTKLKQTEVDCEFLKRCCQTLMEENRKLQNEVKELRAFKLSPMIPPTTLAICPSCEHFAVPPSATTSSVCPSTGAETPQVQAMSTITIDSISTCAPPTGLNRENQMTRTLFL
ncbi:Homeobox-leucine zipper protein HAT4 [Heracleum sosnowskyi]|uniref:Homeobox-leucine zipper protein HAT4 n=1 Tax=Heracleum sosnowskyi TaxID=360622 RepID=A0AAD8MR63_9APIA|nr:Homeobox-leucine zipper protein HAT4 [Heracleum sosnowskyi]